MKQTFRKLTSMLLSVVMALSLMVTPTMAADTKDPPTEFTSSANFGYDFCLEISNGAEWLKEITQIEVDGAAWSKGSGSYSVWNNTCYYVDTSSNKLYIGEDFSGDEATCVISAAGYNDLTLKLNKGNHKATVVENNGAGSNSGSTGSGSEKPTTPEKKTINVSDVKFESNSFGSDWYVTFGTESENYINAINGVSVNDQAWEIRSSTPYTGGSYCKYNNRNYMNNTETLVLAFAQKNYSSDSGTDVLKSGDIITITAEGYNDLTFKLVIDQKGNATVSADTTPGDIYQLLVKIVGSFESAIVGQKKYDGVTSATTGGASGNKNSSVTVYGALVEKGNEPTENDWEELDYGSKISLKSRSVSIVPDTEKGTPESADSGMEGVYMKTSSDLTLDGTPKDAGSYLISISVTDDQGRTATSNTLPFRIYTGEETLADQIQTKNLKQYSNGLYAWNIMEPWAIKNFGSNVDGETNSVRVPEKLEVWYGSHESGTYGVLGYDIAWDDVKAGNIPQTLYIPKDCNLTLMNMKVLSSVRIVVENGGKLTLRDSTVQGIIDVQSGGTFSMNYDSFNQKFEPGASICGQLRLADGATLENAAIYSHTNYLANGNLTDRSNDKAVVAATGNVTVKGQVFIRGDEAGSTGKGQTALSVSDGTLTLADDAVLVTYGGGGNTTLYSSGGSAVELDNGSIAGKGKLVAIGGPVLFGSGDEAVAGTGSIDVSEVFLQGATAYEHKKGAQPGKAYAAGVTVKADKQHIANGTLADGAANDPLEDLYWKSGIAATPDLTKFETKVVETPVTPGTNGNTNTNTNTNTNSSATESKTEPAAVRFTDVQADAYYAKAVAWAAEQGVTAGVSETEFAPENSCTRSQILMFLWKAAGSPAAKGTENPFADISEQDAYYQAVLWAVENGIALGVDEKTFAPNDTVTRAQAVAFLHRAAGNTAVGGQQQFDDISAEDYYAEAVAWALEQGITSGTGDNQFSPTDHCTRAQIVTFLYNSQAK